MAVIIDTNCIANVFSSKAEKHDSFKPVLEWILLGKGLMVYGGSKYLSELRKIPKYLPIIRMLKEVGKVVEGDKLKIDETQERILRICDDIDFDDPHLTAIVYITKCRVICSEDSRSIQYVTNRKFYPPGFNIPVYYTSKTNSDLLCDKYVDSTLKPLCKINKKDFERVAKFLL